MEKSGLDEHHAISNGDVDAKKIQQTSADKPKRKKWRWVLLVLLVIYAIPMVFWVYEDIRWGIKYREELAACRAAGQPITSADFEQPALPEDENAAVIYCQAIGALALTDQQRSNIPCNLLGFSKNVDKVTGILKANSRALQLLHEARFIPQANWGTRIVFFDSPIAIKQNAELSNMRTLAKLACLSATYNHNTGNDAAAVNSLCDVLALVKTLRKWPGITGGLMRCGIEEKCYKTIEIISFKLDVGAKSSDGKIPALRKDVETLIQIILDEPEFPCDLEWAFFAERTETLNSIQHLTEGNFSDYNESDETPEIGRAHV